MGADTGYSILLGLSSICKERATRKSDDDKQINVTIDAAAVRPV